MESKIEEQERGVGMDRKKGSCIIQVWDGMFYDSDLHAGATCLGYCIGDRSPLGQA